jgi:hypothetical protein
MDEEKRKKVLLGGLALVVLFFLVRTKLDSWIRGPIRTLQSDVMAAESSAETLAAEEIQLDVAKRNLEDWKTISLPADVDNSQRLYREWVQSLAEECGFSRISVVPGSKSSQKEYGLVSVEVRNAETDLQGLKKFLFLFDQANILHRIASLNINSPSPKGNPRMTVTLTAEGISAGGAEDRRELLARTPLTAAAKVTDEVIVAAPNELFPVAETPFEPFLIRIDRELLRVNAVTDTGWQVARGAEETTAAAHEADSVIELFPIAWDRKEKTSEQYAEFVKSSFFVIPSPPKKYTPRITGVSSKTIKPGEEVKFTAKADGLDPELGDATFSLADAADGMAIDAKTGEFQWSPIADLKPGDYTATVLMIQAKEPDVKIDSQLKITIKKSNAVPKITLKESAIVVLGNEFTTTATASDEDTDDTLKFSLGGGAPEGLVVDPMTGQLKWTPPKTFAPGKYDIEVKVTDSGSDPQSASAKISLDVQDDFAALTKLTGIIGKDGVLNADFRNQATDVTTQLKEGDKVTVSEIDAKIVSIASRFVTMQDAVGIWKLKLGESLRQRELIEPAPKPKEPDVPVKPETTTSETPSTSKEEALTPEKPESPTSVPAGSPPAGSPPAETPPAATLPSSIEE